MPETVDMPATHLSLHFHVVFSTKNRDPRIDAEWRDRLHAFVGGVARTSHSIPEAIGGVADHVHILLGLNANARLSDVVRDIKAVSSKWVHDEIGDRTFAWQEGYGAFTVSPSHRDNVRSYIARQEGITGSGPFKRNIWNSSSAAAWSITNDIFGESRPSAAPRG